MNKRAHVLVLSMLLMGVGLSGPPSAAQESGDERFFAACAHPPRLRLHQEGEAPRSQKLFYAVANLMELEVIRLADWTLDLPIPGPPLRPLEQGVIGLRSVYHAFGTSRPVERFGQFVDAFQLPELSFGDLVIVYDATTEGALRPGGGMMVRVNKLIDWTQHVTGDFNGLIGWPVGRRQGLVRWSAPGRAVDGFQRLITGLFHRVGVAVVWVLDKSLAGAEGGVEMALNIGTPTPHQQTTVFLRLPAEVYREHAAWCRSHRRSLYVGSIEELSTLTHAQLFHPGVGHRRPPWWTRDPAIGSSWVVVVTDASTMASAPAALQPYVVPAAWVLNGVTTTGP